MSFILVITNITSVDANSTDEIHSKYHSELVKSMDKNGVVNKNKLPDNVKTELENRYKAVSLFLDSLGEKKAKSQTLLNKIKTTKDPVIKEKLEKDLTELKNEIFKIEYNSEKTIGLKKLNNNKKNSKAVISSSYGDAITNVDLYWDIDMETYVITGDFEWQNGNWINDGGVGNIGGLDGIALQLASKIIKIDYGLNLYDSHGNYKEMVMNQNYFTDYSDYGIGFRYQDYIYEDSSKFPVSKAYLATSGNAHIYFDYYEPISSGDNLMFRSKYAHSYDKTSLSGFSISDSGINLNWTINNIEWDTQDEDYIRY